MKKIIDLLKDINKDADFAKSDDFISDGLLDSMDLQMLAIAIEDEYGIRLAGAELVPMNFASIEAIAGLLASHGASEGLV